MRKTALTFVLTAISFASVQAQSAYDAWLFSENNYEGTARSVAMGNAFTALGGDLGAVTINPAASAVASYSQFTLTPSLTISTNTSAGVPYKGSSDPYFQKEMKSRMTEAGIPNLGITFNFDTGRRTGLKSVSAGFVMNRSNSWCEDIYATGVNSETSFLASLAAGISGLGITPEDLLHEDAYYNPNIFWKEIVGYRSGMFSSITSHLDAYVGSTENLLNEDPLEVIQGGPVRQTYGRSVSGGKNEYLLNIGANISDFIYIGFNLGINSLTYDMSHYFKEGAVDTQDFPNSFTMKDGTTLQTEFKNAVYNYHYYVNGSGVYGKLGIIVTPGRGFRFGAAIQTPTSNNILETRKESAECNFTDSRCNGSEKSPSGDFEYDFNSPFRANFGLAYTLGKFAVLSADYELADYSGMKFKYNIHETPEADIEYFDALNEEIKALYGTAHYLRIGAEVRPMSTLAVRAGYNLSTSAQKAYFDSYDESFHDMEQILGHNLSFGLGYNSKKSFFADVACRYTFRTDELIYPYADYLLEEKGIFSPEILSRHSNWKVLLTLGWRF